MPLPLSSGGYISPAEVLGSSLPPVPIPIIVAPMINPIHQL